MSTGGTSAGGANTGAAAGGTGTGSNNSRNRRGGRNNRRTTARTRNVGTLFKGTVTEMNGHVFQCYGEATEKNTFARIIEELDGYVGLQFKQHPADIKKMIKLMEDTKIKVPKDHNAQASKTEIRIWEKEVDMFVKQRETYGSNKCALYSVVWRQCSEAMQAKIKSDDSYNEMYENSDSLGLIKVIKGIAYKFESQKNIYLALDNAKSAFYAYQQGADETNASYMSRFKNTIEVIEHFGGSIGEDKALVIEELKIAGCEPITASVEELELAMETCHHFPKTRRQGTIRATDYRAREPVHQRHRPVRHEHHGNLQPTCKLQEAGVG
jgi:hypothetical protein